MRRAIRIQPVWAVYGLPPLLIALTLAVSVTAAMITGHRLLILFVIPVLISGYVGGRSAALIATILASLSTAYFMFPSIPAYGTERPVDAMTWLSLVVTGILTTALRGTRRRPAAPFRTPPSRLADAADRTLAITEWKVRGGFVVALAGLGAVCTVSYFSVLRLGESLHWVTHTQEVLKSSQALLGALTDAETQQRGYIISGDEAYLASFPVAVARANSELQRIRDLTTDNPAQAQRLDALAPIISRRLRALSDTVRVRREQGFEAARERLVESLAAGNQTGAIFKSVEELQAAENGLLSLREQAANRGANTTYVVIISGGAAAAIVVWLVLAGLRRDFAHRMRVDRRIRAVNEDLESSVRERTASLLQIAGDLEAEIAERGAAQLKLQSQLQRLNLLQQITRAIGERQDLPSICSVVLASLETHLPADFYCICSYDSDAPCLTVVAVGSQSADLARQLDLSPQARLSVDQNGLSRSVAGALVYESDLAAVEFPFARSLAQSNLRSLVIAPLQVEHRVFGVLLSVRRGANAYVSGECEFLRQLSEHVALAAHQARLHDALRKAYEDLQQSQSLALQQERLRALGQMASGIAHDINNSISPVMLYVESLQREPDITDSVRSHAQIIGRAIGDVAHTVARLRDFSRPRDAQSAMLPVDLNDVARQVIELTHARWRNMAQQRGVVIHVTTEFETDLPQVMGIAGELRDAMVNLIFNAVDAMPRGGKVTLRTRTVASTPPTAGASSQFVRLEVIDDGIGMDDEARRRCMEPFFTTKGERGTGLGLAMVYGIMQRHGSDISIESAPGKGSTFRFNFPIPPARVIEAATTPVSAMPPLDILVVDDDPLVSAAVRETLKKDGHRTSTVEGGQEGIDAFRAAIANGAPFQVVVTDLGMPHVDGYELSRAVKQADPGIVVILLTGWGTRMASDALPPNVDFVVAKPPTRDALRSALSGAWQLLGARLSTGSH